MVEAGYSREDSLLLLLNTRETFDVLQRHIPYFVNLTEHGLIPPFPTDVRLADLLMVPEARLSPELLETIDAELAAIPRAG